MNVGFGARFANYEVLKKIAAGGMGEVWLARDLRLSRKVAIKLLSPHLTADSARVAALQQEARAASALNHPNVCTIYGLGDTDDGGLFIAMEFIEGTTLRDRLGRNRLTVLEVLDLAVQMATGLAAAHGAGIIHRDIKPENVMIRSDGLVKLLDFGLAKLDLAASPLSSDHSTQTAFRTDGFVAGTIAYMSPEQTRGEVLDARTDIFSMGIVLYEMVTGHQPFAAHSPAVVHDRILNAVPTSPVRLKPEIPPRLEDIVMKALEKDPGLRYQTVSELRTDLVRLKRDTESPLGLARGPQFPGDTLSARRISRRVAWGSGLALAAVVALAAVNWRGVRDRVFPSQLQEIQLTTNSSENPVNAAAISPDGKYVAYADGAGLHLRLIDSGETHTVAVPEIHDINRVLWFPDGSKLIVSGAGAGGGGRLAIWSVSILGGDPRKLRDDGLEASVSPDGSQVGFVDSARSHVWVMGPNGEEPRIAVTARPGDTFFLPWFEQDRLGYARVRLVQDRSGGLKQEISAESILDGQISVWPSDPGLTGGVNLPDGRVLYSVMADPILNRDANLWIARSDAKTGRVSGQRRIREWPGTVSLMEFTASADGGRVLFLKRTLQKDVYLADLTSEGVPVNPRRFTLDDSNDLATNWTPDSKAILFNSDRNGTFDIFRQSLDSTVAEPILSGPDDEWGPMAVTPDGAWLYYLQTAKAGLLGPAARNAILRTPFAGGPREKVADTTQHGVALCAKAPSTVCVLVEHDDTQLWIYSLTPDNVRARRITTTSLPNAQVRASISPDGSRVAVQMPTERRIRVLSLNGDAPRDVQIPDRSLDGSLFFWSADGAGWYVSSTSGVYPAGTDLLLVDLNGHARVVRHQNVREWMSGIPAPDGRHIALTETRTISNVWMLKNF